MARKTVLDLSGIPMFKFEKQGEEFSGYYVGKKEITTDYGPGMIHAFQTDKGLEGIYGSAQIDSKLGSIAFGNKVFVTFSGKRKIPGGKTLKEFIVEWDDEDTVDPAVLATSSFSGDAEGEVEEEQAPVAKTTARRAAPLPPPDEEVLEEGEEEADVAPVRRSVPAAAPQTVSKERAAGVSALLNRSRRA